MALFKKKKKVDPEEIDLSALDRESKYKIFSGLRFLFFGKCQRAVDPSLEKRSGSSVFLQTAPEYDEEVPVGLWHAAGGAEL